MIGIVAGAHMIVCDAARGGDAAMIPIIELPQMDDEKWRSNDGREVYESQDPRRKGASG